jgi:hypothetical protein
LAAALLSTFVRANADQRYDTVGEDIYRVESSGTVSRIVYAGSQRLSVKREGKQLRFEADARYTRAGNDASVDVSARFVQVLLPNGSLEDRVDQDPDFLTILDQPFAIKLDAATLRDLRGLRGRVPFDAISPLGGETVLRGFLRPGPSGPIAGRPAVGVRFEASGPMTGRLPGYAAAAVSGRMEMDGTAYYALDDALLLALRATLTIVARLSEGEPPVLVPVRIVYRRSIRAGTPQTALRTPRPTPPAAGAGTVPPAAR